MCGFLRNVTEQIDKNYIPREGFDKKVEEFVQSRIDDAVRGVNVKAEKYDVLKENMEKFQEASGLDLSQLEWGWNKPEKIGEAVKQVLDGRNTQIKEELERLLIKSKDITQAIEKELNK